MTQETVKSRSKRRRKAANKALSQLPFAQLRNDYPLIEIISAEQIEAIHDASLKVLETVGINFLLPEARALLKGLNFPFRK